MSDEVICLSSDDEKSPDKADKSVDQIKIKQSSSFNSSVEENNGKKRKLDLETPVRKKIHLISVNTDNPLTAKSLNSETASTSLYSTINSNNEDKSSVSNNKTDIKKEKDEFQTPSNVSNSKNDSDADNENGMKKPLLIVRKKHPANVSNGNQDNFAMFISQCLQRDRSEDMEKIVEKLKRRYEELDPLYAFSQGFADFLNYKRECLLNEKGYLYRHIGDVRDEMKRRKQGKCNHNDFDSRPAQEYYDNDSEDNESETNEHPDEDPVKTRRRKEKIIKLVKTMEIVQKRIQKYEEAEVDFDDEDDSVFLKLERYKKRMVELHSMWCKLTNSDENAGRSYLLPKHLNKLTGIVVVDNAINSFINAKLAQKRTIDCVIFPDYIDILNLIHTHNVNNNLGMDQRAERAAAKSAFIKLGEYLQRVRQEDLFDSFSAFYEKYNDDDPATKFTELSNKLQENDVINKKNMNELLEQYSKMQEERQSDRNNKNHDKNKDDDDDNDGNDDEEEDSEEDDDDDPSGDDERDVSDVEVMNIFDCDLDNDQANEESSSKKNNSTVEIDKTNKNKASTKNDSVVNIDQVERNNSPEKVNSAVDNNQGNKINSSTKNDSVVKIDQVKKTNSSVKVDSTIDNNQANKNNSSVEVDSAEDKNQTNKNNSSAKKDCVEKIDQVKKKNPSTTDCIKKVNQVDEENSSGKTDSKDQVNVLDGELVNNEKATKEQPVLKLRSFAKPPKFWQSSQDVGNISDKKGINQTESTNPIEIIDIDDSEEQASPSKNTDVKPLNKPPRIVKILTKSVGIKKILKKTVITNNDCLKVNDQKIVLPSAKVRILPLNKNAQHVNVTIVKPGVALVGSIRKPNENVVQSSTVTTTVGRVLNPMAKIHPNGQRIVQNKSVVLVKKNSVNT